MPKYLFQATYAADGIKGLEKDKASGRKAALSEAWDACEPPHSVPLERISALARERYSSDEWNFR